MKRKASEVPWHQVSRHRWQAFIYINDKQVALGSFRNDREIEAAKLYNEQRRFRLAIHSMSSQRESTSSMTSDTAKLVAVEPCRVPAASTIPSRSSQLDVIFIRRGVLV